MDTGPLENCAQGCHGGTDMSCGVSKHRFIPGSITSCDRSDLGQIIEMRPLVRTAERNVYIAVCICICMYVCMYMHVCAYMYRFMDMSICITLYTYAHMCAYAYICICMCKRVHLYMHTYVCKCAHTCTLCVYTHVCVYVYAHRRAHMYTCICICIWMWFIPWPIIAVQ